MPVEQNEILPNIAKRMSLNRFFAVQRDIVNDELEALVPDLIEDALENPTGTYQRTSKSMSYQMTTIDRTTKSIKEDTVEILRFLNKDLTDKLNNIESGGGGSGLGLIGSILGALGLSSVAIKNALSRLKGNKPPVVAPPPTAQRNQKTGRFSVKDLPADQRAGRRLTDFISEDEARRAGLTGSTTTTPAPKSQSTFSRIGSKISGFFSSVGSGISGATSRLISIGGKLLTPAVIAALVWKTWTDIESLPKPPAVDEKVYRQNVIKLLLNLAKEVGFVVVAASIGGIVAGSVSGPGAIAGIIAGLAVGISLDVYVGATAADLINNQQFIDLVDSVVVYLLSSDSKENEKNKKATEEKIKRIIKNAAQSDPYKNLSEAELAAKGLKRLGTENMGRSGTANLYQAIDIPRSASDVSKIESYKLNYNYGETKGKDLVEVNKKAIVIIGNEEVLGQVVDVLYQDPNNQRYIIRYSNGDITDTGHRTLKFLDEVGALKEGSGAYLAARQMAKAAAGTQAGSVGPSYAALAPTTMTDAGGYGTSPLGFGPLAGAPAGGSGGGGGGSGTSAGGGAVPSASSVSVGPMSFAVSTSPRASVKAGTTRSVSAPTSTATATPTAYGSNSFVDMLAELESNNRNIYSEVDPDTAGPGSRSQGYFQIGTPTWKDFAPKAGVDISKYPNAMSAPRSVQEAVARKIPLKRFGPRTRKHLMAKFGNLNLDSTIGELASPYETAPAATSMGQPTATQESGADGTRGLGTFKSSNSEDQFGLSGTAKILGLSKVDPRLVDIMKKTSEEFPLRVRLFSGKRGSGAHGKGLATDIQIFDDNGNPIPSYQSPESANIYRMFAEKAREIQMRDHPELTDKFVWGGAWKGMEKGGAEGKYGSADLMDFRIGHSSQDTMSAYKWGEGWQKGYGYYTEGDILGIGNRDITPEDYEKLKGFKLSDQQNALFEKKYGRFSAGYGGHSNIGERKGEASYIPPAQQPVVDTSRSVPQAESPPSVSEEIQEMRREQKSFLELQRSSDAGRATTVEPVATLADMSQTQFRPRSSPSIMGSNARIQGFMTPVAFGGHNFLDIASLPVSGETGIIS